MSIRIDHAKVKAARCSHFPAGFWAPIVAIMMVVVAAGLSADIINKELKEVPACAI